MTTLAQTAAAPLGMRVHRRVLPDAFNTAVVWIIFTARTPFVLHLAIPGHPYRQLVAAGIGIYLIALALGSKIKIGDSWLVSDTLSMCSSSTQRNGVCAPEPPELGVSGGLTWTCNGGLADSGTESCGSR